MHAYREAQRLYGEAMVSTATGAQQITRLEQILQQIGDLVPQAEPTERAAVLQLNTAVAEMLVRLTEEQK
ncbi:MAG TPA: hypothetical protein VG497_11970 [Kribbella sp.]|nr:hypothetical protein [Kribbella sp.]